MTDKKEILNIAMPEGMDRVETQPISFGDDWAGMFVRGDKAFKMAGAMSHAATRMEETDPMNANILKSFANQLLECIKK